MEQTMPESCSSEGAVSTRETFAPDRLNGDRADAAPARKAVMTARNRYNAGLKLIRRGHLFTGLFMTPWVFLYGVSGILFNHPEAFPDRDVRTFSRADSIGTGLEDFPDASTIASRVVAAINAKSSDRALKLTDPEGVAFSRNLIATASGGGREYRINVDLESGLGTVAHTPAPKAGVKDDSIFGRVELTDSPRELVTRAVPSLAAKLGLDAQTASVRTIPDVAFSAESKGRVYRLSYNLRSGAVSAREDGEPEYGLTTRAFLTQLHKKRTYPARIDSRWFWAVSVDAASVIMVLWGISGLLMWWQIKSMRRWGLLVIAVSLATASLIAFAMHGVLSTV
jgi:hypothetical protein